MLFPTVTFALFFAAVLPLSWLLMPHPRRWKPFILAVSYVFYGAWDWRFVALLAATTVANIAFGRLIATARRRRRSDRTRNVLLGLCVAANLSVLGWFKYYGFFADSMAALLERFGLGASPPLLQVVLPVAVSFFTFQAISYCIDIHRGDAEPASPLDFAVYLSFFPHLVAGPIVRPREFIPQLAKPRDPRRVDVSRAVWLIGAGLAKKLVVASFLAEAIVDPVFDAPGQHSALEVLVAVLAFAVQIYADFSGYTDMAIGIALLLGFRFPENFDRPYTAVSLQDFWRRWHMTLSRWLRDYVYIPLGGSRRGTRRTTINLLLTMLLGGLWHGAAWTFVIWGGIHGIALAFEHRRGLPEPDSLGTRAKVAGVLSTFGVVCFAWVFFRSDSLGSAIVLLSRLFVGWGPAPLVTGTVLFVIALALLAQWLLTPARVGWLQAQLSHLSPVALALLAALALVAVDAAHDVLVQSPVDAFIYFQF